MIRCMNLEEKMVLFKAASFFLERLQYVRVQMDARVCTEGLQSVSDWFKEESIDES